MTEKQTLWIKSLEIAIGIIGPLPEKDLAEIRENAGLSLAILRRYLPLAEEIKNYVLEHVLD